MNALRTTIHFAVTAAMLGCHMAHAAAADYTLPLPLATEAALGAIHACEAAGYHVSAAVVDSAGQLQVQLKGDRSTPHTGHLAFRKAYSVVTFAPNYNLVTSAEVGALMSRNPTIFQTIVTLPNVAPIPGAVAIKWKDTHVGALGVSGAPGGDKDEACARVGITKISDRFPK
jgi:uncharacterized protein GlcG (DUF336 family)